MVRMWFDMRRRLRSPFAKWFVALLLGFQLVPITYACVMPMAGASMAYVDAVMPEPCADLPKEACLVAYIQDDRAIEEHHARRSKVDLAMNEHLAIRKAAHSSAKLAHSMRCIFTRFFGGQRGRQHHRHG